MNLSSKRAERERSRKETAICIFFFILLSSVFMVPSVGNLSLAPSSSGTTTAFSSGAASLIPVHARAAVAKNPANQVNVYALYSQEPAPMGIADYGVGPNGPYQYSTNSFLGVAKWSTLSVQNASGYPLMGFQLNVNLAFTTTSGSTYTYWIQDVAQIDTSQNSISILDNVWNSSASASSMVNSGINGGGVVANCNCSNNVAFYYDEAPSNLPGNDVYFTTPMSLQLEVNSTLSSSGNPEVIFAYNDGYRWQVYDTVSFPVRTSASLDRGFLVDGFNYNPGGVFYDAEMILGGPGGGANTSDVSSSLLLGLEYYNGHNYQRVYNAYNFGSDTAEGISNVRSSGEYLYANGSLMANVAAGSGSLGKLYDQTQVSIVSLRSPLASGILYVVNTTYTSSKGAGYAFSGGVANVTLSPGTYTFYIYNSNGAPFGQLTYTVRAGQLVSLNVGAVGSIPLTFSYSVNGGIGYSAPVLNYVSNGQAQAVSLSTSAQTFYADPGTSWSLTAVLNGSTSSERWLANESVSGTASGAETTVFNYVHQYFVSIAGTPSGEGSTTPSGGAWYNSGQSYTINARAVSPYFFASWSASNALLVFASSTSASTTMTVGGPGSVTAQFSSLSLSLGTASGTVSQGSSIQLSGLVKGGGQTSTLSVSGLPSGATPDWSSGNSLAPTPVGVGFTLTIGIGQNVAAGTYTITVSVSGVGSSSEQFALTVRPAVALTLSYTLQGSPSSSSSANGVSRAIVTFTYNGSAAQAMLSSTPTVMYVDQGARWNVSASLNGASALERWATNQSVSGNATSSMSKEFVYYHQYDVTFNYHVMGGSGYAPPSVVYTEFGTSRSITPTGQSEWVDAGTNYTYTNPLGGSDASARWYANTSASGTVSPGLHLDPAYALQYYVTLGEGPQGSGSLSASSGWVDDGSSLTVSPVANSGWKFEFWNGSYSGTQGQITISVSGAVSERATFYPGLTIGSSGGGSVSYSYGSTSGTVGSVTQVVYVPPGTSVTLSADPSSFLNAFNSWSGSLNGTSDRATLTVDSPGSVKAQFGYSLVSIGAIIVGVVGIVVALGLILKSGVRPKV